MKKSIAVFFLLCFLVEIGTSLLVWSGQPSHGLVDLYRFSFVRYETERLIPWAIIVAVLSLMWVARNLRYRRTSRD